MKLKFQQKEINTNLTISVNNYVFLLKALVFLQPVDLAQVFFLNPF